MSAARPSVALLAVGDPTTHETWSGVTAGILDGLRDLGLDVRAISVALPRALERALLVSAAVRTLNRYDAEGAAVTRRVRSVLARRFLTGTALDGAIQIGTTFTLGPGVPFVTLEDMTLRQGTSSHPVFSRMSARTIDRWERQRAEIYARAVKCTAASNWAAASLRDDYGVPISRIAVVGFGANHHASAPERDWGAPRFLFVGVDWQRKGGPEVLRAFSRVREIHPHAALDVVGGHPSLRQSGVQAHGVLSRVRERDRALIAELFASATCFVMPSRIEPFGIAYVEAASAGIPSIGSSIGGAPDVIGNSGGIVVQPGNEQALIEAMLCVADPDTARRMGRAARERSSLYTWSKVAERLLRSLGLQAPDGRELAQLL